MDAFTGGLLVLPATPELIVSSSRRGRGRRRRSSDHCQRHAGATDAASPQDVHGRLVVFAIMAHAGPIESGEKALAPFRKLAVPLADMVRPITYPEIYAPEPEDYHPTAVGRTMFLDKIDLPAAEEIVARLEASDASVRVAQLRVLGGAMSRVPAEATAFAHRTRRIMVNLAAFYEGPLDRSVREAWVKDFEEALQQGDNGVYVNFLTQEGDRSPTGLSGLDLGSVAPSSVATTRQLLPPQPQRPPGLAGPQGGHPTPGTCGRHDPLREEGSVRRRAGVFYPSGGI
jgi:hypothetical protein